MRSTKWIALVGLMLFTSTASAEKPGVATRLSKQMMAAKDMLMKPEMAKATEHAMMEEDSTMAEMLAEETIHAEVMHDPHANAMIMKSMIDTEVDGSMMSEQHVMEAHAKMIADPSAMQSLFNQLVARHMAMQNVGIMKRSDSKMMSPAGKVMMKMVGDSANMMMIQESMKASENGAMMMAREELLQSLMHDPEIMAIVECAAKSEAATRMNKVMKTNDMQIKGQAMMQDDKMANGMVKAAIARQKVGSMLKRGSRSQP